MIRQLTDSERKMVSDCFDILPAEVSLLMYSGTLQDTPSITITAMEHSKGSVHVVSTDIGGNELCSLWLHR